MSKTLKKRKNSRTKGHGFERDIANLLNEQFKKSQLPEFKNGFRRVPLSGGFDKRRFTGDIMPLDIPIENVWDISLECKFYKDWKAEELLSLKPNKTWAWIVQAVGDVLIADKNHTPVVIVKHNHASPVALVILNTYSPPGLAWKASTIHTSSSKFIYTPPVVHPFFPICSQYVEHNDDIRKIVDKLKESTITIWDAKDFLQTYSSIVINKIRETQNGK